MGPHGLRGACFDSGGRNEMSGKLVVTEGDDIECRGRLHDA